MSSATALLGGALFVLVVLVAYLIYRVTRADPQKVAQDFMLTQQRLDHLQNQLRLNLDGNTQLIQQQMDLLTKQLSERLGQSAHLSSEATKQINERMDNAAKVFGELQNKLGRLEEANQKLFDIGKDMTSLQEILKKPKARGNLGEFFLADLLGEMLPRDRYEIQYQFKNNEQVDAIIRLGDSLLSIDPKFPLDNFRRLLDAKGDQEYVTTKKQFVSDVKKHVDSIAKKYIQPGEGTLDFALMYVMAENVFYEMIVQDDRLALEGSLQDYAFKKRVIMVSPNSFYAYLGALMYALRGERMQKDIHDVVSALRHLSADMVKFRDDFDKIGHHLNNARGSYESSEKRLNRYQDRLEKLQEGGSQSEPQGGIKLISTHSHA